MKKLLLMFALVALACNTPRFFPAPAPFPTFDTDSLGTYVAGTANAAFTQTAFFITPSPTPTFTSTPTRTATPQTPTATPFFYTVPPPTGSVTPTGYEKYTIEYLHLRSYGGGEITSIKVVQKQKNFTTYLVKYPSDGLIIHALMSVPHDTQKHAVIITIHGYASAKDYNLYEDDRVIDNRFAQEGFIVIHPAMRNCPPSGSGENLFRVGQTVDILNLVAIIKAQSGKPGLLEYADGGNIGLEGYSMGGGISLRALTVNPDIKAAVLRSSISGDERLNVPLFDRLARNDSQFEGETIAPDSALEKISPSSYYNLIATPVMVEHGVKDTIIPVEWAKETCYLLQTAGVDTTCHFYEKMGHSISGSDRDTFLARAVAFFNIHLR
jgi:dienelactone hydrolase